VTPPINPDQLAHLMTTLSKETENLYDYLFELSPRELLRKRIDVTLKIKNLEKERGAVDAELQRIYSLPELQWGIRDSDGWVLRQRSRTSGNTLSSSKIKSRSFKKTHRDLEKQLN